MNIYHFFVCMSLFFFLSCTKVGLGYKYVSNEVKDKIQESFDFNAKKEKEINAFLDENFSSRKKDFLNELKGYVIKLQKISDVKELTLEKVDEVATDFSLLQKNIINLYKISFEKVVFSVENSEKENFIRYSNENISEMLEKSKNKEAFIKTKIKNFHRAVVFLLDDVNEQQKIKIDDFVRYNFGYYESQINVRKKFYSSFVDLYPDHSKMLKLSLDYYSGEKSIRESEYAKQRDDFEANYKKLLLDLWKNSSEKQRAFFKNRLSVIIDEINKELD